MTDESIPRDPVGPEPLDDDVLGGGADDTTEQLTGSDPPLGRPEQDADDPTADSEVGDGGDGTATMAPPPPPPPPPTRRLVRDPTSRLGGVASGLAHYYGIDTSIVRILVLVLAVTTGFGFLAYVFAWLIIPRADYWPPAGPTRPIHSLSSRDLGLGLAVGGLLLILLLGAGDVGSVLVPLVLVGGGVWLLVQQPTTIVGSTTSALAPAVAPTAGIGGDGPPPPPSGYVVSPEGRPVPPRSGRRKAVMITLLAMVGLFVLLPVIFFGLLIAAFVASDFDIGDPVVIDRAPQSADAFPLNINRGTGEVRIDLTELSATDIDDLAALEGQAEVTVELDLGSIVVIVPEDLPVSIDAEASAGNVVVFERTNDGLDVDVRRDESDAVMNLNLDVGLGEIRVERE